MGTERKVERRRYAPNQRNTGNARGNMRWMEGQTRQQQQQQQQQNRCTAQTEPKRRLPQTDPNAIALSEPGRGVARGKRRRSKVSRYFCVLSALAGSLFRDTVVAFCFVSRHATPRASNPHQQTLRLDTQSSLSCRAVPRRSLVCRKQVIVRLLVLAFRGVTGLVRCCSACFFHWVRVLTSGFACSFVLTTSIGVVIPWENAAQVPPATKYR
mmetsp:Transcript_14004/g.29313  ORF Transcript_14004/g.29313 Transcript_14004/m.29313 type:complete len:212 (+) Transcript_14004:1000-1635(+)